MFCEKCGVENKEEVLTCSNCGAPTKVPEISGYAGLWRRAAALAVDYIVLYIVCLLIGGSIAFINEISWRPGASRDLRGAPYFVAQLITFFILFIVNWPYFTIFESSNLKATPGKLALGLAVSDLAGNKISFARANGRYWSKLLSVITFFVGFLLADITPKKQALHDIIAKTVVLRKTNPLYEKLQVYFKRFENK